MPVLRMIRYAPGVDPRLTPHEQQWERFCIRYRMHDLLRMTRLIEGIAPWNISASSSASQS